MKNCLRTNERTHLIARCIVSLFPLLAFIACATLDVSRAMFTITRPANTRIIIFDSHGSIAVKRGVATLPPIQSQNLTTNVIVTKPGMYRINMFTTNGYLLYSTNFEVRPKAIGPAPTYYITLPTIEKSE